MGIKNYFILNTGDRYYVDRYAYNFLCKIWDNYGPTDAKAKREAAHVGHWRKHIKILYKWATRVSNQSAGRLQVLRTRGKCVNQHYRQVLATYYGKKKAYGAN